MVGGDERKTHKVVGMYSRFRGALTLIMGFSYGKWGKIPKFRNLFKGIMHWTHKSMGFFRDSIKNNYLGLINAEFFLIVGRLHNVFSVSNHNGAGEHIG